MRYQTIQCYLDTFILYDCKWQNSFAKTESGQKLEKTH